MKALIDALKNAKQVAILPHVSADGDAIGSAMGLAIFLEGLGISSHIYTEEKVKGELSFLGGQFSVLPEAFSPDTAVAIDCGDALRLGTRAPIFETAKTQIVIDHHGSNDGFGHVCFVESDAAATAEIVTRLFLEAGVPLTKAATPLYTGIVTDTGGFRFSNTTGKTHTLAAALLEAGADSARVCREIFDTVPLARLRLEAKIIETMSIVNGGRTAIATLPASLLEEIGAKDEDAGNLSGILRTVEGVEAGVLLREKEDGSIKLSMRTNTFLDAAAFCKALGGGGHARAAGATLSGSLEAWKEKIIESLEEAYGRHC